MEYAFKAFIINSYYSSREIVLSKLFAMHIFIEFIFENHTSRDKNVWVYSLQLFPFVYINWKTFLTMERHP